MQYTRCCSRFLTKHWKKSDFLFGGLCSCPSLVAHSDADGVDEEIRPARERDGGEDGDVAPNGRKGFVSHRPRSDGLRR